MAHTVLYNKISKQLESEKHLMGSEEVRSSFEQFTSSSCAHIAVGVIIITEQVCKGKKRGLVCTKNKHLDLYEVWARLHSLT